MIHHYFILGAGMVLQLSSLSLLWILGIEKDIRLDAWFLAFSLVSAIWRMSSMYTTNHICFRLQGLGKDPWGWRQAKCEIVKLVFEMEAKKLLVSLSQTPPLSDIGTAGRSLVAYHSSTCVRIQIQYCDALIESSQWCACACYNSPHPTAR